MKKIIAFTLLLMLMAKSFSQQTIPTPTRTRADYLQKSKKQKTAAWLLLGGGFLLGTGGMFMALENTFGDSRNYHISKTKIGVTMFYAGGFAVAGSIPIFIAAARNKGRSMSIGLKMEKTPIIQQSFLINTQYPAVSIKITMR